jgi:hypothetical protein
MVAAVVNQAAISGIVWVIIVIIIILIILGYLFRGRMG